MRQLIYDTVRQIDELYLFYKWFSSWTRSWHIFDKRSEEEWVIHLQVILLIHVYYLLIVIGNLLILYLKAFVREMWSEVKVYDDLIISKYNLIKLRSTMYVWEILPLFLF